MYAENRAVAVFILSQLFFLCYFSLWSNKINGKIDGHKNLIFRFNMGKTYGIEKSKGKEEDVYMFQWTKAEKRTMTFSIMLAALLATSQTVYAMHIMEAVHAGCTLHRLGSN